jgi:aspartate aminotransferase
MTIAKKIEACLARASWIRKMFEEGARMKAQYGADQIFDFSLGNPNLPPPEKMKRVLADTVERLGPNDHGYMPNGGYPHVRQKLAQHISGEHKTSFSWEDILMTCGAAGALNVVLKAILDPGDEVLTPSPYFVEYNFYVDNHGGTLKTVPTRPDFTLDLVEMEKAFTGKTRAVLINSPNNPTGQVYSQDSLMKLAGLLTEKGKTFNRTIYLISDEPYRKIIYDGVYVPSIFEAYRESIVATSYSKEYSVPGERIGYLAVSPEATYKADLLNAMTFANRILGFVNAPALMQRVVAELQGESVDVAAYQRKRDLICDGLADAGFTFTRPAGAFYVFPRTPVADDVDFVRSLQEERILTVPGSGFGAPGHFRIAFCVADGTIIGALPGFKKTMEKYR